MRYEVRLSDAEKAELGGLIGHTLDWLGSDGCGVEIRTGDLKLRIVPEEEHTPDAEHPYAEATRPQLSRGSNTGLERSMAEVGSSLGIIRSVRILSTFVSFSPVTERLALALPGGVVLGPSPGYEEVHHASFESAAAASGGSDPAVVGLDLGMELSTDLGHRVRLFTLGYSVRVSVDETGEIDDERVYVVALPPPA
jgi:hypothetical protein